LYYFYARVSLCELYHFSERLLSLIAFSNPQVLKGNSGLNTGRAFLISTPLTNERAQVALQQVLWSDAVQEVKATAQRET
jgi:hypothetical protein